MASNQEVLVFPATLKQSLQMETSIPIHYHAPIDQMQAMVERNFKQALYDILCQIKIASHSIRELHSAPMNAQDDDTENSKLYIEIQSNATDEARLLQQHILPSVEKIVKELMNTAMLYEKFALE